MLQPEEYIILSSPPARHVLYGNRRFGSGAQNTLEFENMNSLLTDKPRLAAGEQSAEEWAGSGAGGGGAADGDG